MNDSIDDALGADHQRLDVLLKALERGPSTSSAEAFTRGLLHHMTWEDQHLFPAVKARATEKERRSIESLEIDHERLRDTLKDLATAVAAGDVAGAGGIVRWLGTLLQGHNYDEEHGVYVEADRLLSRDERRRLIERFSAKPRNVPG